MWAGGVGGWEGGSVVSKYRNAERTTSSCCDASLLIRGAAAWFENCAYSRVVGSMSAWSS